MSSQTQNPVGATNPAVEAKLNSWKARAIAIWRYLLAGAALIALTMVYHESNGFRGDISWTNWLLLGFIVLVLTSAVETLIASAVAKGIAKAKELEVEQLKRSAKIARF